MYKFRYIRPETHYDDYHKSILQVMQTHEFCVYAQNGQIIQRTFEPIKDPQWQTVETIYDDAEYDKARGWKMPKVYTGEDK